MTNGTNKPVKKTSKANNEKKQEEKVYIPGIPEPTKRTELLEHWINLTLDDKTANKMLWISDAGSKVSRKKEEVCPVLDGPARYEYSPQVVCKEGIWNSRAYFEVEVSGWVVVGITYEDTGRRANSGSPSGLGENDESWGLCWAGSRYQVWYDGQNKDILDVPESSTLGLYVDQPAGIIAFYTVNGEGGDREVTLLHRMKTTISRRLLPGFWVGIMSQAVLLRPE